MDVNIIRKYGNKKRTKGRGKGDDLRRKEDGDVLGKENGCEKRYRKDKRKKINRTWYMDIKETRKWKQAENV